MNKQQNNQGGDKQGGDKTYGIFHKCTLERRVLLAITEVGRNAKQNLERKIVAQVEGRCIPEGYVRINSVRIISYTAGVLMGESIAFQVIYECLVSYPVENMIVDCVARSVTDSAGVRAEVVMEDGSVPLMVFVTRDHNYTNLNFSKVKEGDQIQARIIGVTFEVNDPMIYATAYYVDPDAAERRRLRQLDSDA